MALGKKGLWALMISGSTICSEPGWALSLSSSAFQANQELPSIYTCIGKNISPPLAWTNAPLGTQSWTLVLQDPDAPAGVWTHWAVVNLPASTRQLAAEVMSLPSSALILQNSWQHAYYEGPCPSSGQHHYVFHLYALDKKLPVTATTSINNLSSLMQGHVLAQTTLTGTFSAQ